MTRDDLDRLAAEHVLGLLEGEEAARAAALLDGGDRDFAAAVHQWRERLSELDEAVSPQPTSDALWRRIESALDAGAADAAPAATPVVVPSPLSAFRALWRSLHFWRFAGLAATAAALALGIGLASLMAERARGPALVAVLMGDGNQPVAIVNAFADGRAELVPIAPMNVPQGRSLEVWTLWDRAQGPVSIGVLDRPHAIRLRTENRPRLEPNQVFHISLEPAGGSPTGKPTGPVLMTGHASTAL